MSREPQDRDWVDRVADVAAALGLNRVRVRWKLDRLRRSLNRQAEQARGRVAHVGYTNKVCPHCTAVNDVQAKKCASCGKPLHGRFFQVLSRLGIVSPAFSNVSAVLGIAMVLIYARMLAAAGTGMEGIFSMETGVLFAHGASYAGAFHNGEWYRLLTSVFLHAGLWHLGFNLFALSQLGPFVEEIFGKARMLIYFVGTGIVASMGSLLVRAALAQVAGSPVDMSVAIGASGAIMGLMGIMAGWGMRDGTGAGRHARNTALKWAAYTLIFGFFIGADNGAHAVGFIAGGFIGLSVKPSRMLKSTASKPVLFGALLSGLLAAVAVVICLIPVPSNMTESFERQVRRESLGNRTTPLVTLCTPLSKDDLPAARRQFYVLFSPHIFVSQDEIDKAIRDLCRSATGDHL